MLESFKIYNGGVKLYFGRDVVSRIKRYLKQYKNLLIVTGRKSATISGALPDVSRILDELGIDYRVYSGVRANPDTSIVEGIVEEYRGYGSDGFIAIGGGSVIDAVKAARAVIAGGGRIEDYLLGGRKPPVNQPFLLAVNLTHGTGTEIDRYSVVTITREKLKIGFSAGYPDISIDDPYYTRTLPRNQTIYTSLDAFAHAVESATSTLSSPYTRLLAREAVKLIVEYLPRSLEDPGDLEARYWLLYASMIAGIGIDHGATHLGHGLEHVLSGFNPDLPHGAGLGILYRKLIEVFYQYFPETLAEILKPLNENLKPRSEDAVKARRAYEEFLERIGFSEKLRDYGFDEDIVGEAASFYMENPVMRKYHGLSTIRVTRDLVKNILLCAL